MTYTKEQVDAALAMADRVVPEMMAMPPYGLPITDIDALVVLADAYRNKDATYAE